MIFNIGYCCSAKATVSSHTACMTDLTRHSWDISLHSSMTQSSSFWEDSRKLYPAASTSAQPCTCNDLFGNKNCLHCWIMSAIVWRKKRQSAKDWVRQCYILLMNSPQPFCASSTCNISFPRDLLQATLCWMFRDIATMATNPCFKYKLKCWLVTVVCG